MADERELLVAFAEWYGQAYAANFIPKGTIDAFLAARQPQATPPLKPLPDDLLGSSCDWGDCCQPSICLRAHADLGDLPVCGACAVKP